MKKLIAHRGASAHAPENTMPAFELALRLGADTLEHDLQVTKDGVLVCLHDLTLQRTTNVREVFPARGRMVAVDGQLAQQWFVHDFTLAEIKQLDAGSWFHPSFAGTAVPTFQELLECVQERGELLTELKDIDQYEHLGIDPFDLFVTVVHENGCASARHKRTVVTAQSFHSQTVRRGSTRFGSELPWVLLIEAFDGDRWIQPETLRSVREFASGIGPHKSLTDSHSQVCRWAHDVGLSVTPWTFASGDPGRFGSVRDEMEYFLRVLDVDGVITNDPDQCPRSLLT